MSRRYNLMKLVITGGAGFIGSNLAFHLKSLGYDVIAVDNFARPSGYGLYLLDLNDIKIVRADIRDIAKVKEAVGRFDVLIHAAAYINVAESIEKPVEYTDVNVKGTVAMLHLAVKSNAKRFIYISSAAVYGEPIKLPIDEGHPTNPISPYGATKLAAEYFVKTFNIAYGLEYIILRLFNVYGPGQSPNYAGLIVKTLKRVLRGEPPIIYGDGTQTRDFVYIKDVVEAISKSIETEYTNNIFNIGSGREYKVRDVVDIILRLTGRTELKPIYAPPRPGDIYRSVADISKAKKLLGYQPRYSIEDGIKELIKIINAFH